MLLKKEKDDYFNIYFLSRYNSYEDSKNISLKMISKFSNEILKPKEVNMSASNLKKDKTSNIKCCSCKASIEELKIERGNQVYFCAALNSDGESTYICDLCLQGY